jgi:molybdate/tungstate transport system permease protein
LTLRAALYATIFALLFGVPLAYLLARFNFPGRKIIEGVIDLPIMIPHTAAGIALLSVFGRRFWAGKLFGTFGIGFVGELPGIVLAMIFVSLPFLVNAAKEGFCSVDPRLEKVARSLGAGPWRMFRDISLPLCSRHILSGAIMMWARGISEFGAVVILAYHPMVAPVLIYERFNAYGLNYSRPVAVLLVLICLAVFVVLRGVAVRKKL